MKKIIALILIIVSLISAIGLCECDHNYEFRYGGIIEEDENGISHFAEHIELQVCTKCGDYIEGKREAHDWESFPYSNKYNGMCMRVYHCKICDCYIPSGFFPHTWHQTSKSGNITTYECSECGGVKVETASEYKTGFAVYEKVEITIDGFKQKTERRFVKGVSMKCTISDKGYAEKYPNYKAIVASNGKVVGIVTNDKNGKFEYYLFSGWQEDSRTTENGQVIIYAHATTEEATMLSIYEFIKYNGK